MLTNTELGKMLEDCRRIGEVTSTILRAVESIARGYLAREKNKADMDDIVQSVLIRFCRIWQNIRKNPIAFIRSLIRSEMLNHFLKIERRKEFCYDFDFWARI